MEAWKRLRVTERASEKGQGVCQCWPAVAKHSSVGWQGRLRRVENIAPGGLLAGGPRILKLDGFRRKRPWDLDSWRDATDDN